MDDHYYERYVDICRSSMEIRCKNIFSGHRQLTGYTRSMLLYSEDNARWEIWDNFNNRLQATLNSTAPMPIGVNPWQFVEAEECRNEKSLYRKVTFS